MSIVLDGSFGEGGGQIIRTSLTLSAMTGKSVIINNIRSKREKPGLKPQHLTACFAIEKICRGCLRTELNSRMLEFQPGKIVPGDYEFDIGTAGSAILVAQTVIPLLLVQSRKSTIRIIGGTHVLKSPSYDYFAQVFLPALTKFGAKITSRMFRPGYYPAGGGLIEVEIMPSSLIGETSWKDTQSEAQALINLSKLDKHIAVREEEILRLNGIEHISWFEEPALSAGNSVFIWQGYKGSYVAGERGKPAEIVAQEAIDFFKQQTASIDSHLADQLLIYACLAKGKSCYETSSITEHLKTNKNVIRQFISRAIHFEGNKVFIE